MSSAIGGTAAGAVDNNLAGATNEFGSYVPFAPGAATQTEHRNIITSHDAAVAAVISDIKKGSGRTISADKAEELLAGVRCFSGEQSGLIRRAYNNPDAEQCDRDALSAVDEYIRGAPKWKGRVYRGINVSRRIANAIISQSCTDMHGPSSWSSELNVAERFALTVGESVSMIFVLPENHSGASITHISSYNGLESEVTAPSGTRYRIDGSENVSVNGRDYIYVYLHEE